MSRLEDAAVISDETCGLRTHRCSCFVNGEPAAAIVAVNPDGDGYAITPLFVSVTPSLELTDHDGRNAANNPSVPMP
jgi:hypothetical protein